MSYLDLMKEHLKHHKVAHSVKEYEHCAEIEVKDAKRVVLTVDDKGIKALDFRYENPPKAFAE